MSAARVRHVVSDVGGVADEPKASRESKEPLCDGSEVLRFIYVTEGGGQTLTPYYFTEPHGHAFIAIDGECHFDVEDDYMRGVFSGTLTPEDAEELSAVLHWNDLDGWVDWDTGLASRRADRGVLSNSGAPVKMPIRLSRR
jgi:hypothetical protein